jgi:hypothetical protein
VSFCAASVVLCTKCRRSVHFPRNVTSGLYGGRYHGSNIEVSAAAGGYTARSSRFSRQVACPLRSCRPCYFPTVLSSLGEGIQFLKDVRLLPSQMRCPSCQSDMRFCRRQNATDGYKWMCQKVPHGCRCNGSRSIRHSKWFSRSHLTLQEVLNLTYHIVRRLPAASNAIERQVDPTTIRLDAVLP